MIIECRFWKGRDHSQILHQAPVPSQEPPWWLLPSLGWLLMQVPYTCDAYISNPTSSIIELWLVNPLLRNTGFTPSTLVFGVLFKNLAFLQFCDSSMMIHSFNIPYYFLIRQRGMVMRRKSPRDEWRDSVSYYFHQAYKCGLQTKTNLINNPWQNLHARLSLRWDTYCLGYHYLEPHTHLLPVYPNVVHWTAIGSAPCLVLALTQVDFGFTLYQNQDFCWSIHQPTLVWALRYKCRVSPRLFTRPCKEHVQLWTPVLIFISAILPFIWSGLMEDQFSLLKVWSREADYIASMIGSICSFQCNWLNANWEAVFNICLRWCRLWGDSRVMISSQQMPPDS